MEVIRKVDDLLKRRSIYNYVNKAGLVPTQGCIHEGHLSLIKEMVRDCDLRMVSIFVNPTEFDSEKEYKSYPRSLERDVEILKGTGIDILFAPDESEMYPNGVDQSFKLTVPKKLCSAMCGKRKKGGFDGAAQTMTKLMNVTRPDVVFMGQKDYQLAKVVQALIDDLYYGDVDLTVLPTVRAANGLAYSSRANFLNRYQLESAEALYRTLEFLKRVINNKEADVKKLNDMAKEFLVGYPEFELEYLEVLDAKTLKGVKTVDDAENLLLAISGYIGGVRLVDNMVI